jgi:hypothetical protein
MTVGAEKAPEGLSVVKEGQAETGRALKARDLIRSHIGNLAGSKPPTGQGSDAAKECAESPRSLLLGYQ